MQKLIRLNLFEKPEFCGKFLIEASAGTGKTFSISQLFLHAILQGKKVDEILVLSFTEDATKELKDRIRKNLNNALEHPGKSPFKEILDNYLCDDYSQKLQNAISEMDKVAIYTIHGFCYRILNEFAFECGTPFGLELCPNQDDMMRQVILDFCRKNMIFDVSFFIKNAKEFLLSGAKLHKENEKMKEFYDKLELIKKEYAIYKKEKNILAFDDIIQNLHQVLTKESNTLINLLQNKFSLAFVDEFQDTDIYQYEILDKIFGNSNKHGFYMIGDPKQSIYRFRGADINVYLSAKNSVDKIFTLEKNYRSENLMINAVNNIFSMREDSFALNGLNFSKIDAQNDCRKLNGISENRLILSFELNEKFIVDEIKKILDCEKIYFQKELKKNRVNFHDFAILCTNNAQCKKYLNACLASGLPAVIKRGESIYSSEEAINLLCLINVIHHPQKEEIKDFLLFFCEFSPAQILDIPVTVFEVISSVFVELKKNWENRGFITTFYKFLENKITVKKNEIIFKKHLISLPRGERKLTNYQQLAEIINNEENGTFDIQKTITFLQKNILSVRDGTQKDDENPQLLETDFSAIQIMTIHAAKGLEFPIVFIDGIFEKKPTSAQNLKSYIYFHDAKNENYFIPKLDKETWDLYVQKFLGGEIQEFIRVLYVALTRAVNLCYAKLGTNEVSAQTYLFSDDSLENLTLNHGKKKITAELSLALSYKIKLKELSEKKMTIIETGESLARKDKKSIIIEPKEISLKADFWGVSSFTGISYGAHAAENSVKDYDYVEVQEIFEKPEGIFGLPRGKDFGVAMHKVFENFFNFGPQKFYQNKNDFLEKPFIFDDSFALENDGKEKFLLAEKMVENVLKSPLNFGNKKIILANLNLNKYKTELPFFYNLQRLTPEKLVRIFAKNGEGKMAEKLKLLDFRMIEGFMTGFIDLVFEEYGKFYIVDWKTNYLGATQNFYKKEYVENAVFEAFYFLQFYIYSLALHLHLKKSIKNYLFEQHFGGVAYLFVRGINPENPDDGIFFYQPKIKIIEELFEL